MGVYPPFLLEMAKMKCTFWSASTWLVVVIFIGMSRAQTCILPMGGFVDAQAIFSLFIIISSSVDDQTHLFIINIFIIDDFLYNWGLPFEDSKFYFITR